MRRVYYYILACLLLSFASCSKGGNEPQTPTWAEGEAPIAFRATPTRADIVALDGKKYDVYTCSVYYGEETTLEGCYYTSYGQYGHFRQMMYDDGDIKLFYLHRFYFPVWGDMDLLCYGVETGKNITPKAFPEELEPHDTADYMMLDLTDGYDGTFDVIAAERIYVKCLPTLEAKDLPYGHFHHILSHIDVKFRWADGVTATSPIVNRFFINSVQIKDTPCQGKFYVDGLARNNPPYNKPAVADGVWEDTGDDVTMTKSVRQTIPFGETIDYGSSYIIPQAERRKFIVNYTIRNGSEGSYTEKTMNYVATDPLADVPNGWRAGHKYTYVIKIGRVGELSIDTVKVERFADGNVGDTSIY